MQHSQKRLPKSFSTSRIFLCPRQLSPKACRCRHLQGKILPQHGARRTREPTSGRGLDAGRPGPGKWSEPDRGGGGSRIEDRGGEMRRRPAGRSQLGADAPPGSASGRALSAGRPWAREAIGARVCPLLDAPGSPSRDPRAPICSMRGPRGPPEVRRPSPGPVFP